MKINYIFSFDIDALTFKGLIPINTYTVFSHPYCDT